MRLFCVYVTKDGTQIQGEKFSLEKQPLMFKWHMYPLNIIQKWLFQFDFFSSITQLTIDFLTAKTLKWQNRFSKTFSVIKNGCLDAEGEFLKGNVAFHFLSSTTQLKEKCVEIKSLEFHLVHHPLSNIYLKILDFTDNF